MWEILKKAGIDPAQRRSCPAWSQFLRSQAETSLACDFFTPDLLDGTQAYVLAVIEHATRRIRILGVTLHGAPRGALPYSLCSREELGGMFLGLMPYLAPKG